jgi:hypothetical protein
MHSHHLVKVQISSIKMVPDAWFACYGGLGIDLKSLILSFYHNWEEIVEQMVVLKGTDYLLCVDLTDNDSPLLKCLWATQMSEYRCNKRWFDRNYRGIR